MHLAPCTVHQVTSEDVWAKLRTMYDLAAVDDREEVIPFPLEAREFALPRRDFANIIGWRLIGF